jgi:hypothetical protein
MTGNAVNEKYLKKLDFPTCVTFGSIRISIGINMESHADPDQHLNDADPQFWYLEVTACLFADY